MKTGNNISSNLFCFFLAWIFLIPTSSFASLFINIKELDSHFFSEEKLLRTVIIDHDFNSDRELKIEWKTSVFNSVLQQGKEVVTLQPTKKKIFSITLVMPQTEKRIEMNLAIKLLNNNDQELLRTSYEYSVFPMLSELQVHNIKIGLFDPKGNTRNILKKMNIPHHLLENELSFSAFDGDLIIIGSHSVTQSNQHILQDMEQKIMEGMSILCLEQEVLPALLPVQLSSNSNKPNELIYSEIASAGHKVFSGLKPADLSRWRGEGIIARFPLKTFRNGNVRTLLNGIPSEGREIETLPLIMELFLGQGKFILSQLLQVEKCISEPVAKLLFVNLINYAAIKSKPMENALVLATLKNEIGDLISDLGITRTNNLLSIAQSKKIIICSDNIIPDLFKTASDSFLYSLRNNIQNGGTLLIFNLIPELADYLKILFPSDLQLIIQDNIEYQQNISVDSQEIPLWGMSTLNIQTLINEYSLDSFYTPLYFLNFKKGRNAKALMDPCAVAQFFYGKGNIIVCQVPFSKGSRETSLDIIVQLLTNLHILIPT